MPGFIKWITVGKKRIPEISTAITFKDRLGAWKVRWGIGRTNYKVPPGLYAIGSPDSDSPVLVTANYKMSYDIVRGVLANRNCWLLVLETYGINVWCAAGKGTFGTEEIIRRIFAVELANVVKHREIILPILGAPGVASHEVKKRTGFSIRYAAIKAKDIPEYLDNGMIVTSAMRELSFTTWERAVLIPVELVNALKPTAVVTAAIFIVMFALNGYKAAIIGVLAYLGAVFAGAAIAPLLLPWLPGRSFAFKGIFTGLAWSTFLYLIVGQNEWSLFTTIAAFIMLPTISAFYALNFTGCTPFTSRSGVKKEMRIAIPAMAGALAVGIIILFIEKLL